MFIREYCENKSLTKISWFTVFNLRCIYMYVPLMEGLYCHTHPLFVAAVNLRRDLYVYHASVLPPNHGESVAVFGVQQLWLIDLLGNRKSLHKYLILIKLLRIF